MNALTPRQSADLMLGFGAILAVRYGLFGRGTVADWSFVAAGGALLIIGAIIRRKRHG